MANVLNYKLKMHGSAKILVNGISMLPELKTNDLITISTKKEYKIGEILVFEYKNSLIVHRLLKKEKNKFYCKGDNAFRLEDIFEEQIIGSVDRVNGHKTIDMPQELIQMSYLINREFRKSGYNSALIEKGELYREFKTKLNELIEYNDE